MLNHSFSVHAGHKNERRFLTLLHRQLNQLFENVKRAYQLKEADALCYYDILTFINDTFNRSLKRQSESHFKE